MIRFLLTALLFYLVFTLFSAILRSLKAPRPQQPPEKSREGETMELDPQCGTYVPRSDAVRKSIGGQTVYFCSKQCRDKYMAANK